MFYNITNYIKKMVTMTTLFVIYIFIKMLHYKKLFFFVLKTTIKKIEQYF